MMITPIPPCDSSTNNRVRDLHASLSRCDAVTSPIANNQIQGETGLGARDWVSGQFSKLSERKARNFLGHAIGAWYRKLERPQVRKSDHVIHITEAFCHQTRKWGRPSDRTSVIINCGAIDAITVLERENSWAKRQGLIQRKRFLYSGTLALKLNPNHLVALARSLEDTDELIVVPSGVGADYLASITKKIPKLRLLPLQDIEQFAMVLASAGVFVALIERNAGVSSMPSKILSYLCAGRPIVLATPQENFSAQILRNTGAGVVLEPADTEGFLNAAKMLGGTPETKLGTLSKGRKYAEENFQLKKVASDFAEDFRKVV